MVIGKKSVKRLKTIVADRKNPRVLLRRCQKKKKITTDTNRFKGNNIFEEDT